MSKLIEKIFKLKNNNTNIKTEIIAGFTTFMTMAYILVVNPIILSKTGMEFSALITSTAVASIIATLIMAFYANLPFALAPGMGLNAFFAYTVVIGLGYTWQTALTAVFIEGLLFILLTLLNFREYIIKIIPLSIKNSISVGIGFFIAFIGLSNAGIIKSGMKHIGNGELDGTIIQLGDITSPASIVAILGVLFTGLLLIKKVKGSLLIGIIFSSIIGISLGLTKIPENLNFVSLPPSLKPIFFQFDFSNIFSLEILIVLLTFLFVDLFDTVGTLVGVASKANMLDENGNIIRCKQALFADAFGTTCGAILGTSTVTTYIESASGIAVGGKTGLTSLVVAILFFISLFFAPIIYLIPAAATSPALILVGLFMMSPIKKIDLNNYVESIPAFLTILIMPLTNSIANGIVSGIVSYILLRVFSNISIKKNKNF